MTKQGDNSYKPIDSTRRLGQIDTHTHTHGLMNYNFFPHPKTGAMNRNLLYSQGVWWQNVTSESVYVVIGSEPRYLLNVSFVNRHKCDNMKNLCVFFFFWWVIDWAEGTITIYFGSIASGKLRTDRIRKRPSLIGIDRWKYNGNAIRFYQIRLVVEPFHTHTHRMTNIFDNNNNDKINYVYFRFSLGKQNTQPEYVHSSHTHTIKYMVTIASAQFILLIRRAKKKPCINIGSKRRANR